MSLRQQMFYNRKRIYKTSRLEFYKKFTGRTKPFRIIGSLVQQLPD